MSRLLDVILYATYALFNTAAMAAMKTALPRFRRREVAPGLIITMWGAVAYAVALGALLLLLRAHDASGVMPIAVGCVVLVTHVAGYRYYGERLSLLKATGAILIVAGVALISSTGASG